MLTEKKGLFNYMIILIICHVYHDLIIYFVFFYIYHINKKNICIILLK